MKLYNTLTRTKEEFAPLEGNTARIYTCGPTVYNYAHIGNLRTYIFMDILRRSLALHGFGLYHVMNITDVGHLVSDADEGEDKIVKAAREQKKSPWEIAEYYTKAFMRDIERLNIGKPEVIARATEHIDDMIDFVKKLVERGRAYETSDGIYYDISKFPEYGMLSGIKLEEQQAGARVEVNPEKRHPADFTVWIKAPKEHIMQWPSPWGMGYPGWHIECSAMGYKYLGEYFDIHTGGVDHIPIHHENEIAQTCGVFGHPAAKFWMHGEFMLVDGGKMSKSLGNVYTLDELAERGYEPLDFRYFCLNAHYRQKLNFTFSGLDSAKKSLANLRGALASHKGGGAKVDTESYIREFYDAVGDDLNIPRALGVLWNMVRSEPKSDDVYNAALKMDKVFGLSLDEQPEEKPADDFTPEERAEIEAMVAARAEAKKAKNYAEADLIRAELASRGIVLIDTKEGTIYRRA